MNLVGAILVTASLVSGALAAATAYLAPLNLADDLLAGLTLNAPAGAAAAAGGGMAPLANPGEELTPALLKRLREADVEYVQVKQFWPEGSPLPLWPGKWIFLASVAGLVAGALMIRSSSRRLITVSANAAGTLSPDQALQGIRDTIDELRRDVAAMPGKPARLDVVVSRLTELQKRQMADFVDSRPLIVARFGLAGYAEIMDRYAAAERQINRAWSAAADRVDEEMTACLDQASELLGEAITLAKRGN
ncbi:MAG: hypothetical protein WD278_08345 [Pirellulales bacterium]